LEKERGFLPSKSLKALHQKYDHLKLIDYNESKIYKISVWEGKEKRV